MKHLTGPDRARTLRLPARIEDYVGPAHPVRVIDAFVDALDLSAAGFIRVAPKATGRPGYAPADLLKLYIYGYLNRVRSSRRLETEAGRNLEVMWLLRRLRPDFKTIANFRRDNRHAFRQVFGEFLQLCRRLNLFGRTLIAVDGTRIKAVNNRERNFTRATLTRAIAETNARLADALRRLDRDHTGVASRAGERRAARLTEKVAASRRRHERHAGLLAELERTGEDQLSLTDPDSRAMAGMTRVGVGYNVQLAVDVKHKLIVAQEVGNQVLDLGLLAPTAKAAMAALGVEHIEVVADRGYFKIEDIEACEQAGITAHVPKPVRGPAVRKGFFAKEEFRYDPGADVFVCPAGRTLWPRYRSMSRENVKVDYCNRQACATCTLRSRCTESFRRVSRPENEAVLDRMAARPELLDRRRESVEHPFGSIKQWMGQGTFLMRRLENVRAEFSLTALAYNLRRALNLVGAAALVAAARPGKSSDHRFTQSAYHPQKAATVRVPLVNGICGSQAQNAEGSR